MAVGAPADDSGDLFLDLREVVFFAAFRAVDFLAGLRAVGLVVRLADLAFFAGFDFVVARFRVFGLVAGLRERAFAAPFLGFAMIDFLSELAGCES